jgi:hypothetical protein
MKRITFLILATLFLGGVAMAIYQFPQAQIESVELVNGKIEIVKSQVNPVTDVNLVYKKVNASGFTYVESSEQRLPKRVWKEIYIAKNGVIILEKIIEAKIIPAADERWEFSE